MRDNHKGELCLSLYFHPSAEGIDPGLYYLDLLLDMRKNLPKKRNYAFQIKIL